MRQRKKRKFYLEIIDFNGKWNCIPRGILARIAIP